MHDAHHTEGNGPVDSPRTGPDMASSRETEDLGTIEVDVRITPLSLLWASVLGSVILGTGLAGAIFLFVGLIPVEISDLGAGSLAQSTFGRSLVVGALFIVVFATGYQRHGRPVPTGARVQQNALAVTVPPAWGKLIREEIHLRDPRLEVASSEKKVGAESSGTNSAESASDGLVVTGTAPEWWDPGTYEVHVGPRDANSLRAKLTNEEAESPST